MRSSRPPLGRPGEHPCVGDLLGRPTLLLVLTCLWIGWQACAGATWQVLARTRCHATPCHAMPRCLVGCHASPRLASRKVPSCGSGLGSQPSQAKPGQLGWSCAKMMPAAVLPHPPSPPLPHPFPQLRPSASPRNPGRRSGSFPRSSHPLLLLRPYLSPTVPGVVRASHPAPLSLSSISTCRVPSHCRDPAYSFTSQASLLLLLLPLQLARRNRRHASHRKVSSPCASQLREDSNSWPSPGASVASPDA